MIREYLVVVVNPDNFRMAGLTGTYCLIARIGYFTPSIPTLNFTNSLQPLQHSLYTPETPTTHNGLTYHIFCSEILYSDITTLKASLLFSIQYVIVITSIKIINQGLKNMSQQKIKRIMLIG